MNDLERAKLNRKIISEKLYTEGYIEVENALTGLPTSKPLPAWIPKGNLPYIILEEIYSKHQIIEDELDGT